MSDSPTTPPDKSARARGPDPAIVAQRRFWLRCLFGSIAGFFATIGLAIAITVGIMARSYEQIATGEMGQEGEPMEQVTTEMSLILMVNGLGGTLALAAVITGFVALVQIITLPKARG